MRKFLLSALALLAVTAAIAATDGRITTKSSSPAGGVKQLTERPRMAEGRHRNAAAPMRAAEAPANAVEVPFTHDTGKGGTEIKNYTSVNANEDNRKWQYGTVNGYCACMVPNAADIEENDDWLFTVPIHLLPGDYTLSFEVGMMGAGATGVRMNVGIGTEPSVEAMTADVVPPTTYTEKNMTLYEYNCTVAEEGYYYLGFHCTTPKSAKGTLKLANIGMKAGKTEVVVPADPPAAGTLTWELAPKGELKATVTYTAPVKTVSGADLEEISKVIITSRWEVDKFEYTDVTPGQVIVIEDVEMYAGINNRFTAVAYVGETAGEKVEHKNIYCGPDTPFAPQNVKLTPSEDFTSATLSWDPVGETGENGGYVDTENVTYYIFDAFGSYYDPAIATVTGATSYEFTYPELEGQDFVAYQVTAGNGEYYSLDTSSNILTIGQPASLPFTESFTGGKYDGIWLIDPATSGQQQYGTIDDDYFASLFDPEDPEAPEPLTAQDHDKGFYYWLPMDKDAMFGLQSVRADISQAAHPVLDVWYQGQGSVLDILVAKGTGDLEVASSVDMKENPTTGWTLCRVPLDAYKDAGTVSIEVRLRAVHNDDDHVWSVPLDHIWIHDLKEKDLRMASLSCPGAVKAGETLTLSALLENVGTSAAANASVEWFVNGKTAATVTLADMESNGFATASFDYTVPFNSPEKIEVAARVLLEGDECADNDAASAKIAVAFNPFPTVTDLAAEPEGDNQVNLTWSAPDLTALPGPETVTEDFENEEYTAMSITGAGGWTVYDGDGGKTYNIFRETGYNPYQTAPIGFQLFNRVVAGVPDAYWADAEPHSGDTFMMAPSTNGPNDNWLISPLLSGNAQTVTFWAKSMMITWPESFEVYCSTTDNKPESFTSQLDVTDYPADNQVPEVWTEFSVTLPEGARYFAIRHNSTDALALLVDDVTYEAAPAIPTDLAVTGYHIIRDGALITTEPVVATAYTDRPLADGAPEGSYTFSYAVVPVYNYGTAKAGNEAEVNLKHSAVEVIDIADADTADTRYFNLQGIRVDADRLQPGVYIAVSGSESRKVMLK